MALRTESTRESKLKLTVDAQAEPAQTRVAVLIRKPLESVFTFFRNFENLPKFMKDLKEVRVSSPTASHWVVKLKSGAQAEWDAEITEEIENEFIRWESTEGSEVKTSGAVEFLALNGKGTTVFLEMNFDLPGGKLTELFTSLTGESPEFLALTNLRRLKALLETGEIPTIEGQPSGREENSETIVRH